MALVPVTKSSSITYREIRISSERLGKTIRGCSIKNIFDLTQLYYTRTTRQTVQQQDKLYNNVKDGTTTRYTVQQSVSKL